MALAVWKRSSSLPYWTTVRRYNNWYSKNVSVLTSTTDTSLPLAGEAIRSRLLRNTEAGRPSPIAREFQWLLLTRPYIH